MPLIKSGSKEAVSSNISEMMKAGYPQKQAVAAALRVARKYAEGGGIIDETPKSLLELDQPRPVMQTETAAYPETIMGLGTDARTGQPVAQPQPFEIAPQQPKQTGVMERVKEGAKAGFGHEDLGFSKENLDKYPFLYQYQPFARAADMVMRAAPGAIGAVGGLSAGLYEKATGDTVGANRMQRDAYIMGQYPAGGGLASGLPYKPPGAVTSALRQAKEFGTKAIEGAESLIPENAAGAFGGKLKQPSKPKPTAATYDQVLSGAAGYDISPADMLHFKKVGEQKGSNPGGFYQAPDGSEYYVKTPKTADHVRNEKLAAELYKLTGVSVPDLKISNLGGKDVIVSPIIKGDMLYNFDIYAFPGLREGYVVDAWLGNYDVIGTGKDNVVIDNNGVPHRIDLGGSLRYRAQGKLKDNFGPEVTELESMKDPSINWDGYEVFGSADDEMLKHGAKRVAAVTDDQIRDLVQKYGPIHQSQKAVDKLADTLMKRRDYIAERFGIKDEPQSPPEPQQLLNKSDLTLINNYPGEIGNVIMSDAGNDPAKAALHLFEIAKSFGGHVADKVVKSTQEFNPILGDLDAEITKLVQETGIDPWKESGPRRDPFEQQPWTREDQNKYEPDYSETYNDKDIQDYYAEQMAQSEKEQAISVGETYKSGGKFIEDIIKNFQPVGDWKTVLKTHADEAVPVELTPEQKKSLPEHIQKNMFPFYLWKGGYDLGGLNRTQWYSKENMELFRQHEIKQENIKEHAPKNEYLREMSDPKNKGGSYHDEPAHFFGPVMRVAHGYGENAQPFIGFAEKPAQIDWYATFGNADYGGYRMKRLIDAAEKAGHDAIIINNIRDSLWGDASGMHSQVIFLDTKGKIKSPHAEMKDFDSRLLHSAIGGVGIIGGGMFLDPSAAQAEPEKKASGGAVTGYTSPIRMKRGGMLNSPIPGRTDKIPVNVPAGAYVLPADIPSALGQGNTLAGSEILKKMFSSGPYGLPAMKGKGGARPMRWMQPPRSYPKRADGGPAHVSGLDDDRVPIIAAGGEFIVHPDVVLEVGGGDMTKGHNILDRFVLDVRKKHIDTLKKLKPPKR